jgi:hypothetical protein
MRFTIYDDSPAVNREPAGGFQEALEVAAAGLRVSRALADEEALRAFLNDQPSELSVALAQLDVARSLLTEAREATVPRGCRACELRAGSAGQEVVPETGR